MVGIREGPGFSRAVVGIREGLGFSGAVVGGPGFSGAVYILSRNGELSDIKAGVSYT